MVWMRWLPWRFIVRRVARAHGMLDPIALLGRLRRFSQPSEVAEPIELLRAGVVFHARGLINSRVIQHNLDWVWPYWIERQFDPKDEAFVPRAFSVTHVNLTHRNWTAIGLPDGPELPIVDPCGLLTPFYDGWSLDGWVLDRDGRALLPSRARRSRQRLGLGDALAVTTETRADGLFLKTDAAVERERGAPVCRLDLEARAEAGGWAVLSLRPYNPEGISFVHDVVLSGARTSWTIDGRRRVAFDAPAERHHVSHYRAGDVFIHLGERDDKLSGRCEVGMATAAALFRLEPGVARRLCVRVPLEGQRAARRAPGAGWRDSLRGCCALDVPDPRFRFLYEAALRTLVLHAPEDVYAGPYTYRRFWFRDASFIIHALLCAGLSARAERALDHFPARQNALGHFHSQAGEWDSNGAALWIMRRFCELTGRPPKPAWRGAVLRGARWIRKKRLPDQGEAPHAGLLPAGFSAEHLGPNDYYYWDDFWGVAGLRAAAALARAFGEEAAGAEFERAAEAFLTAVVRSLERVAGRLGRPAMPASPYRRLDAGAIGSLAAGYPLQIFEAEDPRLRDTVRFLLENCFVEGAFFQDVIHSGLNAYLSLHVAQVLLRAGDPRHLRVTKAVADLASPTGQWPEAVHPRTGGGCMGDGQHAWAAAEWVLMMRNGFVREEGERLILCAGLPEHWLRAGAPMRFGPAPTTFGAVTVEVEPGRDEVVVSWHADWHRAAPPTEVRLPGRAPLRAEPKQTRVALARVEVPS
ncbi:MAG: hypothetical protein ACE5GS_10680 [Kiloniellaceae bacterium]